MLFFKSKSKPGQSTGNAPASTNESPLDHEALQGDVAVIEKVQQLRKIQEDGPALPA